MTQIKPCLSQNHIKETCDPLLSRKVCVHKVAVSYVLRIGWVVFDRSVRTIRIFSDAISNEMVDVVRDRPIGDCFIPIMTINTKQPWNRSRTYVWLSGRQTSKPRGPNVSFRLLNSQLLAANPPTRKMDYPFRLEARRSHVG
jgi:hypothetical protein